MSKLEQLEAICEEYDLEIRDDYSGRCMYGAECVGVDGEWYGLDGATGQLRKLLGDERKDSMGLGGILYWPGTTLEDLK